MYGIFTYIYHKNQQHVGKYTIHESYGKERCQFLAFVEFVCFLIIDPTKGFITIFYPTILG